MSSFPGGEPADGPRRAVPLGRAPLGSAWKSAGRPRRESLLRHDIADDPDQGIALYDALASQKTTGLSADEWADRLEAIERTKARLAAWEAEGIAGFDDALHGVSADLGHRHPEPGDRPAIPGERRWVAGDLRSVSDEIALILNLPKPHATARIHTACELVHNFAATLHALHQGWLTERAALTIVRELSVLDDLNDLRAAEAKVLAWARTHVLTEIKKECQREAARRSQAASDKRHQRAHDERSVRMIPDGDGRALLILDQDAVDAAAVKTSLSRAATRARRNGDPRSTDQLCADIALSRLLRRAKSATPASVADEPVDNTSSPTFGDPYGDEPPVADEPSNECDSEPVDDSSMIDRSDDGHADGFRSDHREDLRIDHGGDLGAAPAEHDPERVDEASIGAEALVVIHATGAELDALINGEEATGGEADHHGPIPQSSLRKHLIKALAQDLQPNLPTTPNRPHPGATARRPRTNTPAQDPHPTNARASLGTGTGIGIGTTHQATGGCAGDGASSGGRVSIEVQITDRPPPSDPDRYTPSAALDRYVRWRDRTCQFPGCRQPAEFADLDHRIPFAAGGPTTAANLWCLCRHHHRLKHEGGWQIHPNPDGSWTWTSPTGRHYRNNPTIYHPPSSPTG
ncbi:DUF222 domain-containing protein [Kribbella sp. NPDC006257]|uniref:HNH endonuclease signature motif containing protein n=1 Tax=Kribbella sp. NPDC006257 TaxID=3156738 RepID=UPI0033A132A7